MPVVIYPRHPADDEHEVIDLHRSVGLEDYGLPGYGVAVTITSFGTERFVLVRMDAMGARFWREEDIRDIAPHELTGRLPKPFAPICGRTATASGRPCKIGVRMFGDACPRHAAVESARTRA